MRSEKKPCWDPDARLRVAGVSGVWAFRQAYHCGHDDPGALLVPWARRADRRCDMRRFALGDIQVEVVKA